MKYFLVLILTIALFSCKKETPEEPVVIPPTKVPIFEPGDTTFGAAYAEKNNYAWAANTYCKHSIFDSTRLSILFRTYTPNGSVRETFGFSYFSKGHSGVYQFSTARTGIEFLPDGWLNASYSTWSSDGDVFEDHYWSDSTDASNHLTITHIDLVNKRIEGRFHAAFDLQPPRRNPANPLKATFANGRFWAVIRD
jgi:hypothetical protein